MESNTASHAGLDADTGAGPNPVLNAGHVAGTETAPTAASIAIPEAAPDAGADERFCPDFDSAPKADPDPSPDSEGNAGLDARPDTRPLLIRLSIY
jgi:hypothetical protein